MFITPLVLEADVLPDRWILVQPLVWVDPVYGRMEAPRGFKTDLASTPFHVDDTGPSRRPATMHDALYRLSRERGKDWADRFLRDAILAEGGGRVRAWTYYHAVQWFGAGAWAQDGLPVTVADFDSVSSFDAWQDAALPTISTPA